MIRLTNLSMDKQIIFDNQVYVLNEKDLGKADINLATFKGFNQIGVNITGRTLEKRDVSIVGYILADNEKDMLERKRNLQKIVGPFEDFFIVIDDYKLRVSADSTVEYAIDFTENNKWLCKFLISGTCANPCFTLIAPKIVPVAYWQSGFHFPLTIKKDKKLIMGVRQPSMIKMIDNMGEIPTGLIITLRAKANGINNPYILNMLTQEKFLLNCILNKGDTIEINTNYGEKSVLLNGETDYFYKVDIDSSFLQLQAGENYLRYGADSNEENLEIDIKFYSQYLEV